MIQTGINALDRVLGGGFPRGAVTLITGMAGVGKTTLLVQACAAVARSKQGEAHLTVYGERADSIYRKAARVGATTCRGWRCGDISGSSLLGLLLHQQTLDNRKLALVCFDGNGSPHPAELKAFARASGAAVVVTDSYPLKIRREAIDAVDVVVSLRLSIRDDGDADWRVLETFKNRFGTLRAKGVSFGSKGFGR